jgi:ADP-dependent NAD(P)H-hydrate dehydratase / NAD(P)H-hydrate epimerase
MDQTYWVRQPAGQPLFPDLLWSRPENRLHAGKLLIIGGNAQGFAAPAEAYAGAEKAGIGVTRVALPDALQKSVAKLFKEAEFVPSTPSGSFATKALGELLPMEHWADGVLLAGDIGRNSETAILIESLLQKHGGQITLTKDVIEYITSQSALVRERPDTLLVLSFSQLQKLATSLKFTTAFTFTMDLPRTVQALHELTASFPFAVITKHLDQLFVAANGQVSSTPCPADERVWRLRVAASASVWWLQNPSKPFEALTTSLL